MAKEKGENDHQDCHSRRSIHSSAAPHSLEKVIKVMKAEG